MFVKIRNMLGLEPISTNQLFKIDDGDTIILFDSKAHSALVKSMKAVKQELDAAKKRLDEIPQPPSDEELLKWARENYPAMNYDAERAMLQNIIAVNTQLLAEIG